MPDLCLDSRRPFALITTVRRCAGHTARIHPQIDLDLPGDSLRLRFVDPDSLELFSKAVDGLLSDTLQYHPAADADVRVRIHRPRPVQLHLPC